MNREVEWMKDMDMKGVRREIPSSLLPNSFFAWLPSCIISRPLLDLIWALILKCLPALSLLTLLSFFFVIWKSLYYIFIRYFIIHYIFIIVYYLSLYIFCNWFIYQTLYYIYLYLFINIYIFIYQLVNASPQSQLHEARNVCVSSLECCLAHVCVLSCSGMSDSLRSVKK